MCYHSLHNTNGISVYCADFLAVMVFWVFLMRLYGSCPRTWLISLSLTTNDSDKRRLRSLDFFSFMCCLPHRRARTLPLPVTRKRLAAACSVLVCGVVMG